MTGTCVDVVIAGTAVDIVVARATVDGVVSGSSGNHVVTIASRHVQRIVGGCGLKRIDTVSKVHKNRIGLNRKRLKLDQVVSILQIDRDLVDVVDLVLDCFRVIGSEREILVREVVIIRSLHRHDRNGQVAHVAGVILGDRQLATGEVDAIGEQPSVFESLQHAATFGTAPRFRLVGEPVPKRPRTCLAQTVSLLTIAHDAYAPIPTNRPQKNSQEQVAIPWRLL